MKFMGSKRAMLSNGLGSTIGAVLPGAQRFVDLFTGSGSVAWFVARDWEIEVLACDLQQFAVVLAESVISRMQPLEGGDVMRRWAGRALELANSHERFQDAISLQAKLGSGDLRSIVEASRDCCSARTAGPIERAYGGYYFSPWQAIWFDCLRAALPRHRSQRAVALAALIQAASRCAAAPGHTAQPFKPNETAGPFLVEAWIRDPVEVTRANFESLAKMSARRKGRGVVGDAFDIAESLKEGDLAFVDPPYSGVHYSRFYHVLETVARGSSAEVSGTGRYPPPEVRPRSAFSIGSKSTDALRALLNRLAESGVRAIITFPAGATSNGLSGTKVMEIASERFRIDLECVTSRFSTLGGNRVHRSARKVGEELILTLSPR